MLSYPHLHVPQVPQDGKGKPKYSCSLVFTPELLATDEGKQKFAAMQQAVLAAAKSKFGEAIKLPGGKSITIQQAFAEGILKSPFRKDAIAKGYPEGSIFINVRTEQQPGVVYAHAGPDGKPAIMPPEKYRDELYPGCFVRASLAAFGYDTQGNKGVSFALNNLQKLGEGERLDGRVSAENEFEADLSQAPADISGLL